MTPTYLADQLGMSITQVSDYMADRRKMSLQTAVNVAAIVGCQVHELYEWERQKD